MLKKRGHPCDKTKENMMITLLAGIMLLGATLALVEEHVWLDDEWETRLARVLPDLTRV